MSQRFPDSRNLGRAYGMAQVGVEMVVPIGLGLALDRWLGSMPWATVAGAVLGFVGGLVHLVSILNKDSRDNSKKRGTGSP
jgi:F0F1-type ATP synthase assembly protein I